MTQPHQTRILRLPAVVELVGYSKPSIYRKIKDGSFPVPVRLGERATGWRSTDIQDWLDARPYTADAKPVRIPESV